jgi:hypothetical protein
MLPSFIISFGLIYTENDILAATGEERKLVKFPEMTQKHMLANMRAHLRAMKEIMNALSTGEAEKAGQIAENRLGISSMDRRGASQITPYMPPAMRSLETKMRRAASRFALAASDYELAPSHRTSMKMFGELEEITKNCNGCHNSFRIR